MKNKKGEICLVLENLETIKIPNNYIDTFVCKNTEDFISLNNESLIELRMSNFIMIKVNGEYKNYNSGLSDSFTEFYEDGTNGYSLLSSRRDVTSIDLCEVENESLPMKSTKSFFVDYDDEYPAVMSSPNINQTIEKMEDGSLLIIIANPHYRELNWKYIEYLSKKQKNTPPSTRWG